MIPLKLHIKNFVSYGTTTQIVDFAPYQLICLSGKNGHGKSALLDALTWVLWGHARKISGINKADDGLLRIGQTHMMVSLDFSCNSILYRVRREYTSSSHKPFSGLEFGIVDPSSGLFRALTDKTIRTTQDKIESMIGLDYESFINSAFLRQGQSNEFSKKSPKDRKEILATILGLDHFERMRKLAADRAKEALIEKEHLVKLHEQIKSELSQKDSTAQRLSELKALLASLSNKEAEVKAEVQELKQQFQELADNKVKAERIEFQKEQLSITIKEQTADVIQAIQKYRQITNEQKKRIDYKKLEEERTQLQQRQSVLQDLAHKKLALKEQILAKKEAYRIRVHTLEQAYNDSVQKNTLLLQQHTLSLQTLIEQQKELELRKSRETEEYKKLLKELEVLQKPVAENNELLLEQETKRFERRKAHYHEFIAKGNTLTAELKNNAHKKHMSQAAKKPVCPLCEQDLSPDYKKSLQKTLDRQESLINHQLDRITQVIKSLKLLLVEHNMRIEQLRLLLETQKMNEIKTTELQKNIAKALEQLYTLEEQSTHLAHTYKAEQHAKQQTEQQQATFEQTFEKALAEDYEIQKLLQELPALEQSLALIVYDGEEEKQIPLRIYELNQVLQTQAELLKESALQEQRRTSIEQTYKNIKHLKELRQLLVEESATYTFYKDRERELHNKEAEISTKLQLIAQEKELVIHQKGALEQHYASIEQREKEYKQQQTTLKNLYQTIEEYTAIASALSKDGIQALLIEDAIPEIEHEANTLLSRLTDNQAHLTIESLRDLRSGKTKETLDIKISDPIGIRPYELFSGGEAFRIDFALRIAISKLLARRAGTALQTLIIDEGFGSQDEEGLSNIMEALHKIQDDFAKIIVVSHLPSLKEQFPVHFLVYKTAQGSIVKVIENG